MRNRKKPPVTITLTQALVHAMEVRVDRISRERQMPFNRSLYIEQLIRRDLLECGELPKELRPEPPTKGPEVKRGLETEAEAQVKIQQGRKT